MAILSIRFTLVLLLISISLLGNTPELDDLKQQLIDHYSEIITYQAEFQQLNYWQELDISKSSSGAITYDRYNLKLDYGDPTGQFLLLDTLSVTMYDPGSNQAFITDSFEMDIRPIALIMKYWGNSVVSILESDENRIKLELNTNAEETIQFTISDNRVIQLTYFDLEKNSVTYSFSNERMNEPLPQGIYLIELPEDVNLIDTRQ